MLKQIFLRKKKNNKKIKFKLKVVEVIVNNWMKWRIKN